MLLEGMACLVGLAGAWVEMEERKIYVFLQRKYVFPYPVYIFPPVIYIFLREKYIFAQNKYVFFSKKYINHSVPLCEFLCVLCGYAFSRIGLSANVPTKNQPKANSISAR